jgi:hypothetical protein
VPTTVRGGDVVAVTFGAVVVVTGATVVGGVVRGGVVAGGGVVEGVLSLPNNAAATEALGAAVVVDAATVVDECGPATVREGLVTEAGVTVTVVR